MYRIALLCALFANADGAFIGASMKSGFLGKIAKRSLEATVLPDPFCKTGIVSLKTADKKPQSCCAGYCGECGDHPTCEKVRGQSSRNACCNSAVYDMRCGGGAPANDCVKKCSESVPPCIMDKDEKAMPQHANNAADDCTSAVSQWRMMAENAIKTGRGPPKPYELLIKQHICAGYDYSFSGLTLEVCAEMCKEKGCEVFSFASEWSHPEEKENSDLYYSCLLSNAKMCGKIVVDGVDCVDKAADCFNCPCRNKDNDYEFRGRYSDSFYSYENMRGNIYKMN